MASLATKSIVHGSDDSDEEEQQDDALLAKIKIHKEQIQKKGRNAHYD